MLDKEELKEALFRHRKIVNGHWLWTGCRSYDEHGRIAIDGRVYYVSRLSAYIYLGLDIDNLQQKALHKNSCDIPYCFNPDHLYVGTQQDNCIDRATMGRYEKREFCKRGHEFTRKNTYMVMSSVGTMVKSCRICRRQAQKEYYYRKKGLIPS